MRKFFSLPFKCKFQSHSPQASCFDLKHTQKDSYHEKIARKRKISIEKGENKFFCRGKEKSSLHTISIDAITEMRKISVIRVMMSRSGMTASV